MDIIGGLSECAPRYDALLCDVWGVIHNGLESFPVACAALARFRAEQGPVILISNSPRPRDPMIAQMRELGVPDEAWTAVVTSGDATRTLLAQMAPGPAWAVGPARDAPVYEGLGLDLTDTAAHAAFIACTGLFDDEIETPEDYRGRLADCAARGLPMICANPDRVVQRGDVLIWCAGALADLYVELGGAVTMAGKPHAPIYRLALAKASKALGRAIDPRRALCIGDGVPTDIKGANAQGLDVLFVASGINGGDGTLDAGRAEALLAPEAATATYAMADLAW